MQILATHEEQRARNRSLRTSPHERRLLRAAQVSRVKKKKTHILRDLRSFLGRQLRRSRRSLLLSSDVGIVEGDKYVPEGAAEPADTLGHRSVWATLRGGGC